MSRHRHGPVVTVRRGSTDLAAMDDFIAELGRDLRAAGLSTQADEDAAAKIIGRVWSRVEQTTINEFRRALAPHGIRLLVAGHDKKEQVS